MLKQDHAYPFLAPLLGVYSGLVRSSGTLALGVSVSASASSNASNNISHEEDVTSLKIKVQMITIWHCSSIYTLRYKC